MPVTNRIHPGDGDPRHGTVNGYSNHDCRCEACRLSWSAYVTATRWARQKRLTPSSPVHGRYTTYQNHACRCGACSEAHSEMQRRYRASAASPSNSSPVGADEESRS